MAAANSAAMLVEPMKAAPVLPQQPMPAAASGGLSAAELARLHSETGAGGGGGAGGSGEGNGAMCLFVAALMGLFGLAAAFSVGVKAQAATMVGATVAMGGTVSAWAAGW